MRRSLFILVPALALAGCATMIHGTYQQVRFDTPGVTGADCLIDTPANSYRVITPGAIQIERTSDALEITCHKVAYHDATLSVKPHMRGAILLNVFNGFFPGAAYDTASKADYTYPGVITIEMQVDPDALAASRVEEDPAAETPPRKPEPEKPAAAQAEPDSRPADKSVNKSLRK